MTKDPNWITIPDIMARFDRDLYDLADDFLQDLKLAKENCLHKEILASFFDNLLAEYPQLTLNRLAELCFSAVDEWDK